MTVEKFAIVPRSVLDDTEIEALDIAIYTAIASFADSEGKAYPGLEAIMERCRVSRMRTISGISRLERQGHLIVDRAGRAGSRRTTNSYTVIVPPHSTPDVRTPRVRIPDVRTPDVPLIVSNSLFSSITEEYQKNKSKKEENISTKYCDSEGGMKAEKPRQKKPVKVKPDALPPEELAMYNQIKTDFEAVSSLEEITWDHPREGKSLRDLIKGYASKLDRLPQIVATFLDLRKNPPRGNDAFWTSKPPLPSALAGILAHVETLAAQRNPPKPARQEKRCPRCGKLIENSSGGCLNRECWLAEIEEQDGKAANA